MRSEEEKLREDISLLEEWLEQRANQLEQLLREASQRARDLVRLGADELEIESHRKRIKSLSNEVDSLNELRQLRELKIALLDKMKKLC